MREFSCVTSSASFGIGRCREHQRHLQHVKLTALVCGELHLVEAGRLLRELRAGIGQLLRAARVERFGVVGNEVLRDPTSLRASHTELQQCAIRPVEKFLGIIGRWSRSRGSWRADRACHGGHRRSRHGSYPDA